MNTLLPKNSHAIAVTFLIAFALTIIPMPDWLQAARPSWVILILIYWCMALPHRLGVFFAWTIGLIQDVLTTGLLGQHALSYAIVTFITLQIYRRIRVFPLWQQSVTISVLVSLNLTLLLWIQGITGIPSPGKIYWLPVLSSTLIWPPIYLLLRELRRRYHIT